MSRGVRAAMLLTEAELVAWGERLGRGIEPPIFVGLRGPLGAGKSVLARAIARGAGVEGKLPSPTFNLLFRYAARRGSLLHLDLYRIQDAEELKELGWDDLGGDDEIVLVEWPERAGGLLPSDRWDVELRIPAGSPELRQVIVRGVGAAPEPGIASPSQAG